MTKPRTTTAQWRDYYQRNAEAAADFNWDDDYQLTLAERAAVEPSLRQFQLGESSDGRHLIRVADDYARRRGDVYFGVTVRLFIDEEKRHARDLARFLTLQGISLAESDPVDGVFRALRHLTGLESAVIVMLTAEIIAIPYYSALRQATHSPLLRQICEQLLRDEVQHVRFQTFILRRLNMGRSAIHRTTVEVMRRVLLAGALIVVWRQHRRVFWHSGTTFRRLWRTAWDWFYRLQSENGRVHRHTERSTA